MMQFIARLRTCRAASPPASSSASATRGSGFAIVKAMLVTGITPDFIVVDGAEGGTGAAPVEFTDHVGAPLQEGLLLVHNTLVGAEPARPRAHWLRGQGGQRVRHRAHDGAGRRLGATRARFHDALGCIQAQSCHTGHCPTGVTTQDPLRQQALVVPDCATRVAQPPQHAARAARAGAGRRRHPATSRPTTSCAASATPRCACCPTLITRMQPGALLGPPDAQHNVFRLYWPLANAHSFQASQPALEPLCPHVELAQAAAVGTAAAVAGMPPV